MTEDDYISELRARWPHGRGGCASLETIAMVDEAVRAFPSSTRLLVMRGHLIQLGPEFCPHPLEEALRSYQRAVEIDPHFAEGWEEIGHFYDLVCDDESIAKKYFQEAERLREHHVA